MKAIIVALKGMLFGIANLIPGVSGGTMALISGVFNTLLESISNIFKSFKKSMKFLLPYLIGIAIGILLGSIVIKKWNENYPVSLEALFVGLILGGIPFLTKGIKKTSIKPISIIIFLIAFLIVIGLMLVTSSVITVGDTLKPYDYIILFICGIFSAVAMIVPGISGMMFFMLFGYYDLLMETLANLSDFSAIGQNIMILLPIALGVIIGVLTAAKIFTKLLNKYPIMSLFAIIGFVLASVVTIIYEMVQINLTTDYITSVPEIVVSIALVFVGFFITYMISKKSSTKEQLTNSIEVEEQK